MVWSAILDLLRAPRPAVAPALDALWTRVNAVDHTQRGRDLERLGLSLADPGPSPDVYIRVPAARESVFRGAVRRDGVPVSDALQIWLDAGAYPARGPEQANMIYRKVLQPLVEKARR